MSAADNRYPKFEGEIKELSGFTTRYALKKDDGTWTAAGRYEDFYQVGPDRFAVFPYWHGEDYVVVISAAQVLALIAIK